MEAKIAEEHTGDDEDDDNENIERNHKAQSRVYYGTWWQ